MIFYRSPICIYPPLKINNIFIYPLRIKKQILLLKFCYSSQDYISLPLLVKERILKKIAKNKLPQLKIINMLMIF